MMGLLDDVLKNVETEMTVAIDRISLEVGLNVGQLVETVRLQQIEIEQHETRLANIERMLDRETA
jgi:hypothetical protein